MNDEVLQFKDIFHDELSPQIFNLYFTVASKVFEIKSPTKIAVFLIEFL